MSGQLRVALRVGALIVTAIALVQWWQLADRAAHIARMYWKFGDFPVTTSVYGLSLFVVCSLVGATIGFAIAFFARQDGTWSFRLAWFSASALMIGALLWPIAVASPLVRIVEP